MNAVTVNSDGLDAQKEHYSVLQLSCTYSTNMTFLLFFSWGGGQVVKNQEGELL